MKSVCVALMMLGAANAASVNPIRKVVTLMQEMQKEVEAEGETEKELFEKFMCYCKGNNDSLAKQAEDATAEAAALESKVESETGEKKQVDQDLATAKKDRADAKSDLAQASKLREKEATEYAASSADAVANLEATGNAIVALEKGMGSFLQTSAGSKALDLLQNYAENLDMDDKETLASFLEVKGDYAPQSGQIVGILKNMKDEMTKDIGDAKDAEETAVKGFGELKAAKNKEISATTEAVESLTKRSGELAVSVVQNKNAAKDSAEEAADATEFLANLKRTCADKQKEFDVNQKTRAQEVEAISQAIAILNEDDALDLFKKTMKSPEPVPVAAAFLQVNNKKANKLTKAVAMFESEIASAPTKSAVVLMQTAALSQLKSMQKSGKVDFGKVLKMIDDMVTLLGEEQKGDEESKTFCEAEFDKSEDEEKELTSVTKNLKESIAEAKDEIEGLKGEVAAAIARMGALDKTVAEATEQRKKEHVTYTQTVAANNMAVDLIGKAKNKLMQFYNPDLAVTETEPEQTMGDELAASFVQMKSSQPGPAPETAAYAPKGQKAGGVTALMDKLINEVKTGNVELENEEEQSQKDYEELLGDADKSKKEDSKMVADKNKAKADLEEGLQESKRTKSLKDQALADVKVFIADLHKQCDFILENFDARREARGNEVEGLKKAKAVLAGADYSLF